MKTVKLREAKENLAKLVEAAARGRPTTITRHGAAVAVLAPVNMTRTIYANGTRSFSECLLSFPGGIDLERDRSPLRDIDL